MNFGLAQDMILGLGLACGLASAPCAPAQGTIVYHQPSVPLYPLIGQELDLNADGHAELHFYSATDVGAGLFATGASGVSSNRLLVVPQGPSDFGSYLVAVDAGFVIGGTVASPSLWAAEDAPQGYGQAIVLGTWLPPEGNQLIPAGYFYDTTAFMGIHFVISGDWHYGWVRIRGEGGDDILAPQGWILDWAYETRPDIAILAGAVPEPSTCGLLMIGIGVILSRCFGRSL